MVDCFRKPSEIVAASRARPSPSARRCCGCSSASATTKPRASRSTAGLDVVMDRCVKIEHARILGGLNWAGVNTGVISARRRADLIASDSDRCPTAGSASTRCACTPGRSRTRRPARARCRSTRRRRSCSTAPTTRRASSTCRRSATSIRASRIRRSRRSRSASPRSKAGARRSPPPPAWPRRWWRCSRCAAHGDHIVASRTLYGGTYSQLAVTFAQFGIDATFVDGDDPREFPRRDQANTKAVYVETIGNPQLNVADLAAIAAIAHAAGVPLVVDNTLASPYLCRPFEHGADIVVHSVTKYLGGHGTTMGGVARRVRASSRGTTATFRR